MKMKMKIPCIRDYPKGLPHVRVSPCIRDYPKGLPHAPVRVSLYEDLAPCSGPLYGELITEILLRLPVRSLLRFKCVCKSWFSKISDPQFAKLHFDLTLAPTDRLLVNFFGDTKATSIDIDAPFQSDSEDVVFTLPCYAPYPFVKYASLILMGSCRGFLLLAYLSSTTSNLILFVIWNPSTGQVKRCSRELTRRLVCGIGYDSSTDDYLIVVVTFSRRCLHRKVHCFSVNNGSWRYIEDATVPILPLNIRDWRGFTSEGLFLNGTLHWLLHTNHHGKIITFDVKERKLSEIPLPRDLTFQSKLCRLTVMGEYLCVYPGCLSRKLEVWTMKEYKVQSSWTKSLDFVTFGDFSPVCFTKSGEIFGLSSYGRLTRLNDKGELLEFRELKRYNETGFKEPLGMIYRESLLSLP